MLKLAVLAISMLLISPPAINGILPEIRDSLGITQAQSELITTIPSIASLVTILLSSFFLKFISIKKIVFVGLLLTGIGGVIPVFTTNFTHILIGRLILGIGLGLYGPFAIELINVLFDEHERPMLMGYRSASEQIGRSFMTLLAGILMIFSWNMSFIVYGLAFILALLFNKYVPEIDNRSTEKKENPQTKEKLSPLIYLIALFSSIIILNGAAIDIRFPALAAEIMGDGYNSSYIIAVKPLLGIGAGFIFGKLYIKLGKRLLYISVSLLIMAGIIVTASGDSIILLTLGIYLPGIVPAWIFPFIFMTISKKTTGKNRELAMSLVLIALHGTVFAMTPIVSIITNLLGSDSLRAPYPILSGLLLITLICIIIFAPKLMKKY